MLRKDLQKRRYPEDGIPRAQSSSPPSPRRQTLSLPASVGSDTPQLGAPGTTNPPQLKTDMLCWGSNSNGQLGVGDYLSRVYPQIVPYFRGSDLRAVVCGSRSTLALDADGRALGAAAVALAALAVLAAPAPAAPSAAMAQRASASRSRASSDMR